MDWDRECPNRFSERGLRRVADLSRSAVRYGRNAMEKIVLISCVSKKKPHTAKAEDLYISPLFRLNLQYAKSLKPDSIFILSAKYGLLELDQEITPYDVTLNDMPSAQVKAWAEKVIEQLRKQADLQHDQFIFLAGERYRKYLTPHLAFYVIPLQGLTIGKQLHYLSIQLHEQTLS